MAGKGRRATEWLARWGFATLVAAGAIAGIWVAATVPMPADIPSFALRASPVYRLEVGGAVFAGAYLASLALVLALNNRAFSEIGTAGIRAHGIGEELGDRQRLLSLLSSVEHARAERDETQEENDYNEPDDS